MTKQFPNPCCQCGFCCMAEACPVAMHFYNIPKTYPCPALEYDPEEMKATCKLAYTGMIGADTGCCLSARCFKDGIQYDFASLADEIKKKVALSTWKGK